MKCIIFALLPVARINECVCAIFCSSTITIIITESICPNLTQHKYNWIFSMSLIWATCFKNKIGKQFIFTIHVVYFSNKRKKTFYIQWDWVFHIHFILSISCSMWNCLMILFFFFRILREFGEDLVKVLPMKFTATTNFSRPFPFRFCLKHKMDRMMKLNWTYSFVATGAITANGIEMGIRFSKDLSRWL